MKTHKHKGVARSNGTLRAHSVDRKHSNKTVEKHHITTVLKDAASTKKKTGGKQKIKGIKQLFGNKKIVKQSGNGFKVLKARKNQITIRIDEEGYMSINLDDSGCKGLRLTLTRTEREGSKDHKKTVGIQFENNPARALKSGERFTDKKLVVDEQY